MNRKFKSTVFTVFKIQLFCNNLKACTDQVNLLNNKLINEVLNEMLDLIINTFQNISHYTDIELHTDWGEWAVVVQILVQSVLTDYI